ncbi:MAG: hypothetical protein KGH70_03610 [Rhodospirillales bacterium]|nr:hypothetical protein [Rhodospirillales bacterium]
MITIICIEFFAGGLVTGLISNGRSVLLGFSTVIFPMLILVLQGVFAVFNGHGALFYNALVRWNEHLAKQYWFMVWFPIIPASLGAFYGQRGKRLKAKKNFGKF